MGKETMLEVVLKSSKKHVCVKYTNSDVVEKVLLLKAHNLVSDGLARYASKTEYKNYMQIAPKVEVKEEETIQPAEHVHLKAKERRSKNKKNKN